MYAKNRALKIEHCRSEYIYLQKQIDFWYIDFFNVFKIKYVGFDTTSLLQWEGMEKAELSKYSSLLAAAHGFSGNRPDSHLSWRTGEQDLPLWKETLFIYKNI